MHNELHISIDWLSISFKCTHFIEGLFIFKLNDYKTKFFKESWQVSVGGLPFGNVLRIPTSPIMNKDLCILKLENRRLYNSELFDLIDMFIIAQNCTDVKISRLDICTDFQKYSFNRPVQVVLRGLVKGLFTVLTKQQVFIILSPDGSGDVQNYRLGKRSSDISSYIYNKTIELDNVKNKPYIRELWEKLGFDSKLDVYRHEFCINNSNYELHDKSTGEVTKLTYEWIKEYSNIVYLYKTLYTQYFDVRKCGTNKRRDRLQKLVTHKEFISDSRIHAVSECSDSNRSDKIFIVKLIKEYQALREYRADFANQLLNTAVKFAEEKRLYQYYLIKYESLTGNNT